MRPTRKRDIFRGAACQRSAGRDERPICLCKSQRRWNRQASGAVPVILSTRLRGLSHKHRGGARQRRATGLGRSRVLIVADGANPNESSCVSAGGTVEAGSCGAIWWWDWSRWRLSGSSSGPPRAPTRRSPRRSRRPRRSFPARRSRKGAARARAGGGAIAVEAAIARGATTTTDIRAIGSLRSDESVQITTEIAGRIAEITFTEGGTVKAGDVLVKLDDAPGAGRGRRCEGALRSRRGQQRPRQAALAHRQRHGEGDRRGRGQFRDRARGARAAARPALQAHHRGAVRRAASACARCRRAPSSPSARRSSTSRRSTCSRSTSSCRSCSCRPSTSARPST